MRPIVRVLVGGTAVLVAALAFVSTRGDRDELASDVAPSAHEHERTAQQGPELAAAGARDAIAYAEPVAALEPPPDAPLPDALGETVAGRVLDVEGRPVPDVVLAFGRDEVEVAADARGEFSVDAALVDAWVVVRSEERVLVGRGRRTTEEGSPLVVVVARAARLAGRVVHEDGSPAPGIRVTFGAALDALASFPLVLDGVWFHQLGSAVAGADGGFAIEDLPRVPGLVEAGVRGELYGSKNAEPGTGDVELVLRARTAPVFVVTGIVVDARGARVGGASVHLGPVDTISEPDGTFVLELTGTSARPGAPIPDGVATFALVAVHEGHGPALIEGFGARLADPAARTDVVLRLGERALSIEGRVVHADGAPAAGWVVVLADATPLGWTSMMLETIGEAWRGLHTDSDGRFRLGGLLDRTYRVQAAHRETALVVESAPVPAGTRDLVLHVPPDPWRSVEGVVRSRKRLPVPGASVRPYHLVAHHPDGMIDSLSGESVIADAEGRFALPRVARTGASLSVEGNGVEWTVVEIPDDAAQGVDLVVPLLMRFRVELAGSDADKIGVVDAGGTELRMKVLSSTSYSFYDRYRTGEKLSEVVFEVPEEAAAIVLYRDGAEVRRIPLDLAPGEVTLVRG